MNENKKIANLFNGIPWHDSKLGEIIVRSEEGENEIALFIKTDAKSIGESEVPIRFGGVRYALLDIDFLAQKMCSRMVWEASFEPKVSIELKEKLRSLPDLGPDVIELGGLMVFQINLIPPSGSILIIAKEFEIGDVK